MCDRQDILKAIICVPLFYGFCFAFNYWETIGLGIVFFLSVTFILAWCLAGMDVKTIALICSVLGAFTVFSPNIPMLDNYYKKWFFSRLTDGVDHFDLPPKKWTQRRVGFRMKPARKLEGVQWEVKTERRNDLIGISRFPR